MATTDQNFTVYAGAQKVVSAYLQAHNNTLVESGDPLVAAIIALNGILNGLPEYNAPGSVVITAFDGSVTFPARTASGATVVGAPRMLTFGNATNPYMSMPKNYGMFQSGVVTATPMGASVKGVVDNTITKATLYIDTAGVLQNVTLAV